MGYAQDKAALDAVRIKKVQVVLSLSGQKGEHSIETYLWPRVTFEFNGKERTVAFTNWPNRNLEKASTPKSAMRTMELFRKSIMLTAGVKPKPSLRNDISLAGRRLEAVVMRHVSIAATKPSIMTRFQKARRKAHRSVAMAELKTVMLKWEKILEKRDVVKAWNLTVAHAVMES